MLDLHRDKFKFLEERIGALMSALPLVPNHYTLFSLVFGVVAAASLITGNIFFAILLFLAAWILDFIDGAVARRKNLITKTGAYFDTIADRYVESMLLFSLLFLDLPSLFFPGFAWIFLALFGSTMTTYAKAAAFEKGLIKDELKGGLMSRAERIFFYLAALIALSYNLSWTVMIIATLAVLSNITALQRIYAANKSSK